MLITGRGLEIYRNFVGGTHHQYLNLLHVEESCVYFHKECFDQLYPVTTCFQSMCHQGVAFIIYQL